MQLKLHHNVVLLLAFLSFNVWAEGNVTSSGGYYKERSTRVIQPMLDINGDVGRDGEISAHVLIDSITSASVGAGATTGGFTERRYETGASYTHSWNEWRFGCQGRFSFEPDYLSLFGTTSIERDLAQKNTTLRFAMTMGDDQISNNGGNGSPMALREETLTTLLASSSLTQVLSTTTLITLGFDVANLKGYQANMYRTVFAGGVAESERVPKRRIRQATSIRLKQFIVPTHSTAHFNYRFYSDSWGIVGHTFETLWIQSLSSYTDVLLRFRAYVQGAANFYESVYMSANREIEPYLTDDPKLSQMNTQTLGAKIDTSLSQFGGTGRFQNTRIALNFDYIWQSSRFGRALSSQLSLTLPF